MLLLCTAQVIVEGQRTSSSFYVENGVRPIFYNYLSSVKNRRLELVRQNIHDRRETVFSRDVQRGLVHGVGNVWISPDLKKESNQGLVSFSHGQMESSLSFLLCIK